MTKPRPWTTETLMKRVGAFVDETNITETSTVGELFDAMEATIIFEKTGIDRRSKATGDAGVQPAYEMGS